MEMKHGNGNKYLIASIVGIALFFMIRFGTTGLRTILGLTALIFAPIYVILNRFEMDILEKTVLSVFLGIGIISTLVYFLGLVISFRVGLIIIVFVSWVIAILMWIHGSGNKKQVKEDI